MDGSNKANIKLDGYLWIDKDRSLFRVPRKAFVNEDILAEERDRIFSTCWLYLGHQSEIAAPNDFQTRSVGGRNLIFCRDRKGEVRAFYNTCPHRGATVCREKSGTAKSFQCFYHGWSFSNAGKMIGMPGKEAYPEGINDDGFFNLVPVYRLENYRGMYFINFDDGAVSLDSYLGQATKYIDLVLDQAETEMEIVGGTQDYSMSANWKLLVENSIDGYHAATNHATYRDYLANTSGATAAPPEPVGAGIDLGNGHAVIEYEAGWGRPIARWVAEWGEEGKREIEAIKARLVERFGEERADKISRISRNMIIFPNLILNDVMALTLRTFYPVSPDYMNVSAWSLAPMEESAHLRERRLFGYLEFLGPGGFATPDDLEALLHCHQGYKNLHETEWNDISKGMHREVPAPNDEGQMRAFWREWNHRMKPGSA